MRCSFVFFVSLFVSAYAAPIRIPDASNVLKDLRIPVNSGHGDNYGGSYGIPSMRDLPSTDDETETPPAEVPVLKKPRNNSRLSDPEPRSVEVIGALKAAESKRGNPLPEDDSTAITGRNDKDQHPGNGRMHIMPIGKRVPPDAAVEELLPSPAKRDGAHFIDSFSTGMSDVIPGQLPGVAPRDVSTDETVVKRGTTSHLDSDGKPTHPVTLVIPQAVYKRDGDDSTVA